MKLNNFFILFFLIFFITTNSIAYSQIKIETIEYPNGDVYKGEVKDGKPHGVGEWFGSLYTPDGASKYTCDKFIEYVAQNLTSIQAIENFVKLETNFHDVVWDQNYALGEKSNIFKLTGSSRSFPDLCFKEYGINLNSDYQKHFTFKDWKIPFSKTYKVIERKKFSLNQLDIYKQKKIFYIKYKGQFKNGKVHGQGFLQCQDQRYYDKTETAKITIPIVNSDIFLGGFYLCNRSFYGTWENGAKKIGYFKRFYDDELPIDKTNEKRKSLLLSYASSKEIVKEFVSPLDCFVLTKAIWKSPSSTAFAHKIRMIELDRFIYYGFVNENGKPNCAGALIDTNGLITIQQFNDGNIIDGVGIFLYPVKKNLIEIPILASVFKEKYPKKDLNSYFKKMTKDFFHILITQEKSSSILNKFSSSAEDIYNNHDIIFSSYKVVNGNTLINDPEGLKLCFARNGSYLNATWLRTNIVNSNAYCK